MPELISRTVVASLILLVGCNPPTVVPGQGKVTQLEAYDDHIIVRLEPNVRPREVVNLDFFQGLSPFVRPEAEPDHREATSEDYLYYTKEEWAIEGGVLTVVEGHQWNGEGGEYDDYQIWWQPTPRPPIAELLPAWIVNSLQPEHSTVYVSVDRANGREFVQIDVASGQVSKIQWVIH